SNIGSFGEDVYKIGMTRRLEPLDRVKELGDASVPFKFDVHAMIYSDDAPGLENELHKEFENNRVNLVNTRREYFNVSLDLIEQIVLKNNSEIEFIKVPEAYEYRESVILRNDKLKKPEETISKDDVVSVDDLFN
ncbi:MAG: GIY-YIG nuclease family protein, partial [Candidatus Kapabacteria bacterium]|nr:GIY-YIG nuclease family protein [Candidatus Kapabacteria bacterium]